MAKTPIRKNMADAVRETLDSVVTPSVRDTILSRALADAERDSVPQDAAELDEFVQGPLHHALVRSLGPQLGTSVATEVERVVALARKAPEQAAPKARAHHETVRPTSRAETVRPGRSEHTAHSVLPPERRARSTMPSRELPSDELRAPRRSAGTLAASPRAPRTPVDSAPPAEGARSPFDPVSADFPAGTAKALGVIHGASLGPEAAPRPVVLLATLDADLVRGFERWLSQRAAIEPVANVRQLLQKLAELTTERAVVVLDGKSPSVRPLTLAALADELPAGTSVLLWGVPAHLHARMCMVASAAEKWLVAARQATTDEVVARCAKIVD